MEAAHCLPNTFSTCVLCAYCPEIDLGKKRRRETGTKIVIFTAPDGKHFCLEHAATIYRD